MSPAVFPNAIAWVARMTRESDYNSQQCARDREAIRVLVVDDHRQLREGLVTLLEEVPDIEVVGQASNGVTALQLARSRQPDVVIMDYEMPRLNGVRATAKLTQLMPHVKVVGLTLYDEAEIHDLMLSAGATACLVKGSRMTVLIDAIRAASGRPFGGAA